MQPGSGSLQTTRRLDKSIKVLPKRARCSGGTRHTLLVGLATFQPTQEFLIGVPRDPRPAQVRAAAGLLLTRALSHRSSGLLNHITSLNDNQRQRIEAETAKAVQTLNLPSALIEGNWTVDPCGLRPLADRMSEKIKNGGVDELLPVHPSHPSSPVGPPTRDGLIITFGQDAIASYAAGMPQSQIPWSELKPYLAPDLRPITLPAPAGADVAEK